MMSSQGFTDLFMIEANSSEALLQKGVQQSVSFFVSHTWGGFGPVTKRVCHKGLMITSHSTKVEFWVSKAEAKIYLG